MLLILAVWLADWFPATVRPVLRSGSNKSPGDLEASLIAPLCWALTSLLWVPPMSPVMSSQYDAFMGFVTFLPDDSMIRYCVANLLSLITFTRRLFHFCLHESRNSKVDGSDPIKISKACHLAARNTLTGPKRSLSLPLSFLSLHFSSSLIRLPWRKRTRLKGFCGRLTRRFMTHVSRTSAPERTLLT